MVRPIYPEAAKAAKIEGDVVLDALVATDGKIKSLKVISGHPLLVEAATKAVRQWRYQPYTLNGERVEVESRITVKFQLNADKQKPSPRRRIVISEKAAEAHLVKRVAPIIPGDVGIKSGVVVLRAIIAKDGSIMNLHVISGHPMLIPAAIEAARQWRYKPFLVNGKPREVETQVSVEFGHPRRIIE